MKSILLTRVSKMFNAENGSELRVLDDFSLRVEPGEVIGLLGPSGCGKSTVLNIVAGLDHQFSGSVEIGGTSVTAARAPDFRVSYVFQESRLLPWLTIARNIEFVLEAAHFPRKQWANRISHVLELVGLLEFKDYYPLQLSGGMQQRASIARAFSIEPDVLLMDEPFSALDELTARKLRQSLLSIWGEFKTTILFVSHNAFEAAYLADRLLVMGKGASGRVAEEINLISVARPRNYDSTALFEKSKEIVQALDRHSGSKSLNSTDALAIH